MRLTKIVCTIGPSSSSEDILQQLISEGMDIARLNFSHGDHHTHEIIFNKLRELSDSLAIAIDISGPKIRLGKLEEKFELFENDKIQLTTDKIIGTKTLLPVNYPSLTEEVKKGSFIFMNDGFIKLKVESIEDNLINCVVIDDGEISSHKGINVPDADLSIHVPTEKDLMDIEKACNLETDFLFVSFVRCVDDLKKVNEVVETSLKKSIPLIAKIEHQDALKNIKEIIKYSNGLMVARGDLAIEVGPAKVPVVQKNLINLGMSYAKPVIVATQMLESMTKESLPTRAEASDVAHAVFDGANALMLSSETATGKHPIQVVRVMKDIINEAESWLGVPYESPWIASNPRKG
ncbi:MAG: pyruvate kinase [Candidatus Thorarchaeota archaeon]